MIFLSGTSINLQVNNKRIFINLSKTKGERWPIKHIFLLAFQFKLVHLKHLEQYFKYLRSYVTGGLNIFLSKEYLSLIRV